MAAGRIENNLYPKPPLMEADFSYNVADSKPEVDYDVSGDTGELSMEQGSGEGVPLGGDARIEWGRCA